jgi:hypothetical protein
MCSYPNLKYCHCLCVKVSVSCRHWPYSIVIRTAENDEVYLSLLQTDQVEGLRMAGAVSRLHLCAIMECTGTTLHFYNVSFCNVIAYMCACVPAHSYVCEDMFYVERIT